MNKATFKAHHRLIRINASKGVYHASTTNALAPSLIDTSFLSSFYGLRMFKTDMLAYRAKHSIKLVSYAREVLAAAKMLEV